MMLRLEQHVIERCQKQSPKGESFDNLAKSTC